MQRRSAYTLIELLVSMALIMMIMSILSQTYVQGMGTFSKLKGIGDMSEKLREVTSILRRDLAADHFTGAVRLSDPNFCANPVSATQIPSTREGFFSVGNGGRMTELGGAVDGNGNPSFVAVNDILWFSVKLRGNRQQDFFAGNALPFPSNYYGQPGDATYLTGYQWAEVCYYLMPIQDPPLGQAMTSPGAAGGAQPLYALYRAQLAVVATNTSLLQTNPANFPLMSSGAGLFNTPSTLQNPGLRGITPNGSVAALLVSNVLNFDVQIMPTLQANGAPNFSFFDLPFESGINGTPGGLRAVQIIIRVYDLKSRQARQITLVQDL